MNLPPNDNTRCQDTPGVLKCISCNANVDSKRSALRVRNGGNVHFYSCAKCGLLFKDPSIHKSTTTYDYTTPISERGPSAHRDFTKTFYTCPDIGGPSGEIYGNRYHDLEDSLFVHVEQKLVQWANIEKNSHFALLEVGCATGFLLDRFQKQYPNGRFIGVDPSPFHAEKASQFYGLDVRPGTLDTVGFDEGQFDFIVMIGNLQLHADPFASLTIVHRLLKPNGVLVCDTKNPASWFRICGRLLSRMPGIRGLRTTQSLVAKSHVGMRYGIPKRLLREALEKIGYKVVEFGTKDLRPFAFTNRKFSRRGAYSRLFHFLNVVDRFRDERAWLEVICRKAGSVGRR